MPYWNLMILVLSYDTREESVLSFQKWLKQAVSDFPTFHAFCITLKEINYKTLLFSRSAQSTQTPSSVILYFKKEKHQVKQNTSSWYLQISSDIFWDKLEPGLSILPHY